MAESWKDDTESVLVSVSYVDIKLAFLLDVYPNLNLVLNTMTRLSLHRHSVACRPDRNDPDMATHDRNSDGHYNGSYDVERRGKNATMSNDLTRVYSSGDDGQWWWWW